MLPLSEMVLQDYSDCKNNFRKDSFVPFDFCEWMLNWL